MCTISKGQKIKDCKTCEQRGVWIENTNFGAYLSGGDTPGVGNDQIQDPMAISLVQESQTMKPLSFPLTRESTGPQVQGPSTPLDFSHFPEGSIWTRGTASKPPNHGSTGPTVESRWTIKS